jgi:hypothetical protein
VESAASDLQRLAGLAFDQPDVAGAGSFLGFFWSEFDALPLAKELEDGAAHRAAVEEVLDPAFVADESEPFVNEEACDSAGWHPETLRSQP